MLALIMYAGGLHAASVCAGVIEGRVIEIPDGATLTVLSHQGASIHRVRLAGVDAPKADRPLWGNSRESLRRLARGKNVRIDYSTIDPKGMLVGTVQILGAAGEESIDPGLKQISSGLGWVDKEKLAQQPEEKQKLYMVAEAQAAASRTGLWRDYTVSKTNEMRMRITYGANAIRHAEPFVIQR